MSTPPLSPSLLQLLWFVRIVEAGSFAESARRAGTTTSAMSKAIARFEQTHGVRLLHRTTHSLSLTEEGEHLLRQGRDILEKLEEVEATLSDLGSKGAAGRVRITAPTTYARVCIIPQLPDFVREYPEINIEIIMTDELVDLAANGIDVAIRSGNLDGLPGHICNKIFSYPWVACASSDYLQKNGVPSTLDELSFHKHIGFRNKATGQIDNWRFKSPETGKNIKYFPRPDLVFDDGEAACSLISAGFGIGWAPSWMMIDHIRSGHIIEVLREWRANDSPLYLVRLDGRSTPPRTRHVLSFLEKIADKIKC